ncbi:hypothetical protein BKA62DRAFT_829007 [Auriculariales sp. MPI-PUGE-AT-0066]|nr:hypothetical protein BKA62DRAFT_829007 [Auriculariales sp. MPI-PUGE-AT-0066]
MHRRVVQFARARRVAQLARARTFSRTATVSQVQTVDPVQQLDRLTARAIKAVGNAARWYNVKKNSRQAEMALWDQNSRPVELPSEFKEKFMASDPLQDAAADPNPLASTEGTYLELGSLLELRRNGIISIAVLLERNSKSMLQVCRSITERGEIFEHTPFDAMWVSPGFVSESLARDCGSTDAPQTPAQLAARVNVNRQIREFEREADRVQVGLASRMPQLYDHVRHADGTQYSELKTSAAAALLVGSKVIPTRMDLFATHRLLMLDAFHYVCHPTAHRVFHTFLVRPLNDVRTHQDVITWMRERNNPQLASFVEKAMRILAHKRSKEPNGGLKLRHYDSLPSFDENDRKFITVLRQAAGVDRLIQKDWHLQFASRILKLCKYYETGTALSQLDCSRFLKDIGVLLPWEDDSWTRPHLFALSREPPESCGQAQRRQELATHIAPPEASVNLRPARDKLYPRDVMEKLRHDFGQLPVYIIDDQSAVELDDGMSIERIPGDEMHHWLHVHIADPTTLLHPEHEISLFARQMACTVYYRHRNWAMLPDALTMNRFSLDAPLRPDWPKDQPIETMSFSLKVRSDGHIADSRVRAGYIRNPVVLHYDAVSATLGDLQPSTKYPFQPELNTMVTPKPLPTSTVQDLELLDQVTTSLKRQRLTRNTFFYDLPRVEMSLSNRALLPTRPYIPDRPEFVSGVPELRYGVTGGSVASRAMGMVSESMIQAARVASVVASELGVPILRRQAPPVVYESPEHEAELLAMRDPYTGRIPVREAIVRNIGLQSSSYTLKPAAHVMLGIADGEGYARATSPLRRYLDLITHWQLKAGLLRAAGVPPTPLFSDKLLQQLAAEQQTREHSVGRAMDENERFWAIEYIQRMLTAEKERPGQQPPLTFDAMVVGQPTFQIRTRYFFIKTHIPEIGLLAFVTNISENKSDLKIGDTIRVQITKTQATPPTIYAEMV